MTNKLLIIISVLIIAGLAVIGRSCADPSNSKANWDLQRSKLVNQLDREGIHDKRVLEAIGEVPRHEFVPALWRSHSYENRPLPIGLEQTISQPYIVAYMCQELHLSPADRVLEIGTGSGYHAAVMSLLCKYVYTIEIIEELGKRAEKHLKRLGFDNVKVRIGDGYKGWPEEAEFDAIILTAAPRTVPEPLKIQLKTGGRLIAPVGEHWQELVLIERTHDGYTEKKLLPVRFVPMTGQAEEER